MATSKHARWHHGNLLPALVHAADQLIADGGRSAVSLRAVAARVPKQPGQERAVTHTAAMAHVSGVLELLAHVSAAWWERLAGELGAVCAASPVERLVALGGAYRQFAVEHPHHFRLLYDESMWRACEEPDAAGFKQGVLLDRIVAARDAAFGAFVRAVEDGTCDGTLRNDCSVYVMARVMASLSHGLAMEALDERLPSDDARDVLGLGVDGLRASTFATRRSPGHDAE